jgi:hypothetical protein
MPCPATRPPIVVEVREQVWQAEAVEETEELADERPLPAASRPAEVAPFSMEARTVAIAAAGGIVAGAATVVVAKAVTRAASPSKRPKRTITGRPKRRDDVIASRSFLVDVHLLGR